MSHEEIAKVSSEAIGGFTGGMLALDAGARYFGTTIGEVVYIGIRDAVGRAASRWVVTNLPELCGVLSIRNPEQLNALVNNFVTQAQDAAASPEVRAALTRLGEVARPLLEQEGTMSIIIARNANNLADTLETATSVIEAARNLQSALAWFVRGGAPASSVATNAIASASSDAAVSAARDVGNAAVAIEIPETFMSQITESLSEAVQHGYMLFGEASDAVAAFTEGIIMRVGVGMESARAMAEALISDAQVFFQAFRGASVGQPFSIAEANMAVGVDEAAFAASRLNPEAGVASAAASLWPPLPPQSFSVAMEQKTLAVAKALKDEGIVIPEGVIRQLSNSVIFPSDTPAVEWVAALRAATQGLTKTQMKNAVFVARGLNQLQAITQATEEGLGSVVERNIVESLPQVIMEMGNFSRNVLPDALLVALRTLPELVESIGSRSSADIAAIVLSRVASRL